MTNRVEGGGTRRLQPGKTACIAGLRLNKHVRTACLLSCVAATHPLNEQSLWWRARSHNSVFLAFLRLDSQLTFNHQWSRVSGSGSTPSSSRAPAPQQGVCAALQLRR